MTKARLLAALILALLATTPAAATNVEWTSLTSLRQINRLFPVGDNLYVATGGGLIVISDPDQPGIIYDNLSGLGTADIRDLSVDPQGTIWVAGFGRLAAFTDGTFQQFPFLDNENHLFALHSVVSESDLVWVGTELGLILFSKSSGGGQIQDSYTRFGDFNPSPDVWQVLLIDNNIWLATSEGLAVADRTVPNQLKSPAAWQTYGANQFSQLGAGRVNSIAEFNGQLHLAAPMGLFILQLDPDSLIEIDPGRSISCRDLIVRDDTLYAYCDEGVAVVTTDTAFMMTASITDASTGVMWNNQHWIGTNGAGLFVSDQSGLAEYPFVGAPGNDITDLAVSTDGILTAGFNHQATAQWNDSIWLDRNFWIRDGSTNVIVDSAGHAWVGTWGIGIWHLTDDTAIVYNQTNSTLRGNSDGPAGAGYVVNRGLDTDGRYLFAVAYRALDQNPVAVADLTNLDNLSGWTAFGSADGITDNFVSCLDYHDGWLAVGTDAGGVYRCWIGDDPFDKSDDSCEHLTENNSRLLSDVIRDVKFDPDGVLWVATNFGVSRWDPGYEWFVDVELTPGFGPNVDEIEFDSRGNMWAGALNGLVRMNINSLEIDHFTTLNSGLISDKVRSLSYDHLSGRMYAATQGGISIIDPVYGRPEFETSQGHAFPNPFVIRSAGERLNFNYARNGEVQIHSVAGELVAEFSVNLGWDGTNQSGRPVSSGVYLYLFTDSFGRQDQGKFLLVRE